MEKQKHHQLGSFSEIRQENKDDHQATPTPSPKQKRILHRDLERQRRQEMANLYASLRSLLPLEYIKGKRAISDHMHEAVNYINFLQTNISQLRGRRDRLMKMSNLRSLSSGDMGNANTSFPVGTNISVGPCPEGVEILISSSPKEEVFPLSRVLKLLLAQGLNVVCCVSTTVGEIKVHKISAEVTDEQTSIDEFAMPQKLMNMIAPHSNSE